MKKIKSSAKQNEEFSAEFGDVNGIKLIEPYLSQKNHKKIKLKKHK